MVNAWPVVEVAVKLWLLLLPPPPPPPSLLLLVKGGIQASRAWNMLAPDTPVYTERPRFRYLEFRDWRGGKERKKENSFRSIDRFDSLLINDSFVPFRYSPCPSEGSMVVVAKVYLPCRNRAALDRVQFNSVTWT